MTSLWTWLSRITGFFTLRRDQERFDEEVSAHLEMLAEGLERKGMTAAEARLAARREFGGVAQIREIHREQRVWSFVESGLRDFRHALGQIRRSPGLAAVAILTLALGIGANAVMCQALDVVLFRPLPVRHPEQLAVLHLGEKADALVFDYPLYRYLNEHEKAAGELFARGMIDVPVAGSGNTINVSLVSGNYFGVLGVAAQVGRTLVPGDERADAPPVVVVSHAYWRKHFSGKPDVLGQTLRLGSAVVAVVGVAPTEFYGDMLGFEPDLWAPITLQPRFMPQDWRNDESTTWLAVMARLQPGVSRKQAQAALDGLYRRLRKDRAHHPLTLAAGNRGVPLMQDQLQGLIGALMALVAIILLIACCNLANLLLGRGTARAHEIGIRLALGAGRVRVVRQLLTESLALAALGAAAAWLLAAWGWRFLLNQIDMPHAPRSLDWHALVFTAVTAALATCLFGLVPALAATRIEVRSALASSGRNYTGEGHRQRLGRTLVAVQLSVSLLLLYGAALVGRSLWTLEHRDLGYRPQGVLLANLKWDADRYGGSLYERDAAVIGPLYERLNAIPGVLSAAVTGGGPMSSFSETGGLSTPGHASIPDGEIRVAHVSPRYFETMGIRIQAGRPIGDGDRKGAPAVAVLSEAAVRRVFGGESPLGRRVGLTAIYNSRAAVEVVGVAHNIRFGDPHENFGAVLYVPLAQSPAPVSSLVVRTSGKPETLAGGVRAALKETAPYLKIASAGSLEEAVDEQFASETTLTFFSSGFGMLALALTSLGIYGVVRYAMGLRTREIGIRLALGATRLAVERMVLREFIGLMGVSGLVGAVAAVAGARVLRSAVASVGTDDWLLLAAAAGLLVGVAAFAAWLPARRAARLDPMSALRQE